MESAILLDIAPPPLVAALAGGGILMAFVGLTRLLSNNATSISTRLGAYASREASTGLGGRESKREGGGGFSESISKAVAKQNFAQQMQRDLARADLKLTVGEYVTIVVVATVFGIIIGGVVLHNVVWTIALALAGFFGPRFYVNKRKGDRLKAFNNQLADTITLLANSLRSGYSMLQSMEMVSREARAPVSSEFERVVREVGLGLSPEEALQNLVNRMESEDLSLMVTAINVQREVGGNLAEILDTIAFTIRERVKLKGEIKVLTAQQQISGYVITFLPIALSLALFLISPNYFLQVFPPYTRWCGFCMVGVSVIMIAAGYFVIQQITKIEV